MLKKYNITYSSIIFDNLISDAFSFTRFLSVDNFIQLIFQINNLNIDDNIYIMEFVTTEGFRSNSKIFHMDIFTKLNVLGPIPHR